ncbi:hypothetical protein Tco_0717307 [Tanacetum coccineum]
MQCNIICSLGSEDTTSMKKRRKGKKNTEQWLNLASDTSTETHLSPSQDKLDDGRNLYIATDESHSSFFEYFTHFLENTMVYGTRPVTGIVQASIAYK